MESPLEIQYIFLRIRADVGGSNRNTLIELRTSMYAVFNFKVVWMILHFLIT